MKTFKALGLLLVPAAFGFLVASCGSGGGSNSGIPNGRLNFQIGEFTFQEPLDGATEVCTVPDIQIIVPYNSQLCNNNAGLNQWIGLRPQQGGLEDQVQLLPTVTFRNTSRTCLVETRPAEALIPGEAYYISVDKEGGGSFLFRPGSAAEFTVSANGNNTNCSNAFKIVDTDWQTSDILNFGQYNQQTDEIIFDGEDAANVFVDVLANLGMSFVFPFEAPQTTIIKFNTAVRNLGLRSYIRVYEFDLFNREDIQEGGFSVFRTYAGLTDCSGEPDGGPNGACIYVNPAKPREVIVTHPSSGWPSNRFFMIFVMNRLESENGKVLSQSYYKILR